MNKIEHVVWDWNGTLVDDVAVVRRYRERNPFRPLDSDCSIEFYATFHLSRIFLL